MEGEPRLELRSPTGRLVAEADAYSGEAARALKTDLERALGCAVDFTSQAKALYATDASNYRQVPIGIVFPRSRDDVVEAVRICRKHDAPILARGGGTSLAGQTCNVAICIDFSRHLHHLIDIDPQERRARVEPGCILDRLRDEANTHGLTFGPDPATHNRNTLGGMIGNDSCGAHSVRWGRTADNVERLTLLTYDGVTLEVGPTPDEELAHIISEPGRRGDIYRRMADLRDRYASQIEARYPDIPRRVSGFENLDALLPGHGFDVARAITGTEGTCAILLEATLKLVPHPAHRALLLLGFDDVCAAADSVPAVLQHRPAGLEGHDERFFREVKDHGAGRGLKLFPDGRGWLLVETDGETAAEAKAQAEKIARSVGAAHRIITEPTEQQRVWDAREAGLGATTFITGQPPRWQGWEDSAVAPERLGHYLRELYRLLDRHGYAMAVYGHFGDGLVHGNIDFDFSSEAGIANYRSFLREAAELVTSYGGSLSGEHGDGQARAELLEIMYGAELVRCFREFKAIWDPQNRLNPGKAIDAFPVDSNLRLGPAYKPRRLETWFRYPDDGGSFAHAAMRCVGVGKCRRRRVGDEVMCPSYVATGEEKHSTRGRAHLLHEMTRGEVIADGWESEAVEDALSLCLACKGCKSDCPVGVDVATWKAEFRAHHYQHRRRPRSAYSMALIDRWARIAVHAPALANAFAATPVAKWIAGIDAHVKPPRFARETFTSWFAKRHRMPLGGQEVLLWPDTFNNHFQPETLIAATELLERGGFEVSVPQRPLCCGRPLYDWGFLDRAKSHLEQCLAALATEVGAGIPIIVLEPACASVFKDELLNLFPEREDARALSKRVHYFADFIAERLDRFGEPRRGGAALVQAHCHHHAIFGVEKELQLLSELGLDVERPPQGCCGMAGAFGMARETHEVGRAIGERVLLPRIRELDQATIIVADGFSCREQIAMHTGRKAVHIAELLAERF